MEEEGGGGGVLSTLLLQGYVVWQLQEGRSSPASELEYTTDETEAATLCATAVSRIATPLQITNVPAIAQL